MKKIVGLSILYLITLPGHTQIADSSKRQVVLQGAINFRDIGGYKTIDGKHVKWGKIYRSATLSNLTPADQDKLIKLAIATVIDFRGPYEIKSAPDRLPAKMTLVNLPAGSENVGDSNYMKQLMRSVKNDSAIMVFYKNIAPFGDRYKPVFEQLLQTGKDSALLFHCTAGKDRTGIAAALILYVLGVDEKTILEDYTATNYYRKDENAKAIKGMVQVYHIDETIASNMMAAKNDYLQATFTTIKEQYGNLNNYLEKVMRLTEEKRALLKQKYLE